MAHMATHELQHTNEFYDLMSIICLAAFENGFIALERFPNSNYTSNGQPIISKSIMKMEIFAGIDLLEDKWPQYSDFYEGLRKHVKSK
jgi:hypothetical protein